MEGVWVGKGGGDTEVVGEKVEEVEGERVELGLKLPDLDPLALQVGADIIPVLEQALQAQGMGEESPGVGQ